MKKLSLIIALLLAAKITFATITIIPEPTSIVESSEEMTLSQNIELIFEGNKELANQALGKNFKAYLTKAGFVIVTKNASSTKIKLNINAAHEIVEEGYELAVNKDGISCKAKSVKGAFYALQTIKQLLPARYQENYKINHCEISDQPRFGWRGLMLDCSRHFFSVEDVKAYIDLMAEYKFNVFHWHLTDDHGWRIEIKALPKLTQVGAWRVPRNGTFGSERAEPKPKEKASYGGFYNQTQIKDIVKYAAERNITIVPEIDVPGHSMAVLAAYPELSTKKEPHFVSPGHKFAEWYGNGEFKMTTENTLDPTSEAVYEFIDKVFTEVALLFPGQYIHMGGDECYKGYWEESPEVQAFMKKKKIKDAHALQSYFVSRVQKIINSKGKQMIGWDEIIEGGLTKGATVMSWRGMKGGIEAAKKGHKVVMSPTTYAYLDYMQGDKSVENYIYSSLSLQKSYEFDPVPEEEGIEESLILGGQANLWTEAIPTLPFALYMTYPRAFAISECLWSAKESKEWNKFMSKTQVHFDRFEARKLNICKAVYEPIVRVYKEENKIMCELTNPVSGVEIFYTINNTYPVNFGTSYQQAFELPTGSYKLRTQSFINGEAVGRELIISREDLVTRIQ